MRVAAFFLAVLAGWVSVYTSGVVPWLGAAWLSRSSFGAGGLTIVGENRAGTELGMTTFVFFEGQEVVVEYDTEIAAGSLWFYVYRPYDGVLGGGTSHYVTESGSGTWTMPVTATDVYHVTIQPSVARGAGRGWDLSYSVKWGARWTGSAGDTARALQ